MLRDNKAHHDGHWNIMIRVAPDTDLAGYLANILTGYLVGYPVWPDIWYPAGYPAK